MRSWCMNKYDKYGPGSPYDCATRAARDLPPGPEKAEVFMRAAEIALNIGPDMRDLLTAAVRRNDDLIRQGLANNLWDNHSGELDRWADDGGAMAST
jgi:hypothetical protein